MADVRPIQSLHYSLAAVPSLPDVTAPPYDVISPEMRAELLACSPFNVVEIDLPQAPGDADPYEYAGETLEEWTLQGILAADREPALWALTQDYEAPDGSRRVRRGLICRVRVEDYGPGQVRPHERTQPGPREDRLRLTRATRHNLSPIFALHPGDAWPHLAPATESEPWGEVTDADGTVHRIWRVDDPATHDAVAAALADSELLIADGHHRYETARTYAEEVGGEGPHRYTLACLSSLDDPGLSVFPTHRLLKGLEPGQLAELEAGLRESFDVEEVDPAALDPAGEPGIGVFGWISGTGAAGEESQPGANGTGETVSSAEPTRALRLRLPDDAALDPELSERPEAYRNLDAVILETVVLKGILGMTEDDIAAKRGIGYLPSLSATAAVVGAGEWDCAFVLRSTPVQQVRDVAAAGETMPPKSTYFFPKILTGLVFNPLS